MASLSWKALLAAGTLAVIQGHAVASESHSAQLDKLIDAYIESQREEGVADPVFSPAGFEAERQSRTALLQALKGIDPSRLDLALQIDHRFLVGVLESDIRTARAQRRWANDPAMYLPARQLGKLLDTASPAWSADQKQELEQLLKRLPASLAEARKSLQRPPSRFTREAIFQAHSTLEAMKKYAGIAVDEPNPAILETSIKVLEQHLVFLEQELAPRSDGNWAFGEENYNFILQRRWHMTADAAEILARGRRAFEDTVALATEVSQRIDPKVHWTEVYERLKDNHPSAENLKDAYQRPMDAARQFVRSRQILTLPDGERVITLDTPAAMRRSSPFGTFQSVSPFDDGLEGRLYLTPVEDWMTESQKQNRLRSHHLAWTPVIAVHEAYPGHHAHFLKVREHPRILRRVARESLFSEGWGLYTEELMFRWGFLQGDAVRLTQLRNRLWRAARVILDVSLHTGRMDFESAVNFLVEEVRFDRYAAELEVGMYIRRPTYVLGYLIGMQELEQLFADWVSEHGEPDPPSEFFDRLLTVGAIPPALA
ncbi:MAG: DUF885 domain-containing protein, partial [Xanthomonadales bacterium]|nr:DUF885 domain-containing protein [Xanthomonadales bacterium]